MWPEPPPPSIHTLLMSHHSLFTLWSNYYFHQMIPLWSERHFFKSICLHITVNKSRYSYRRNMKIHISCCFPVTPFPQKNPVFCVKIKCSYFKCTVQWVLTQACTSVLLPHSQIFSSLQELLVASPSQSSITPGTRKTLISFLSL